MSNREIAQSLFVTEKTVEQQLGGADLERCAALAQAARAGAGPRPRRGGLTPGRVTLATVAEALGVSAMTVSNAYNRPEKLSPELRERILAKADESGYGGQQRARAVAAAWQDRRARRGAGRGA